MYFEWNPPYIFSHMVFYIFASEPAPLALV